MGEISNIKVATGSYDIKDKTAREDIETLKNNSVYIEPTGDTTGSEDFTNITNALTKHKHVQLSNGVFYLKNPIILKSGYSVKGQGVTLTDINIIGDVSSFKICSDSADHITLEGFRVWGNSANTSPSIDLRGNTVGDYTGARYSQLKDLHLFHGSVGIHITGAWSSTIENVRTHSCKNGLTVGHTCNNIVVMDCEFTHGEKGLICSPYGGSELYGIRVVRCNFEGNSVYGIEARGTIGLTVEDVYSEVTPTIIYANSTPNLYIHGGQVSGCNTFANIANSEYTTGVFSNCRASINNIQISMDTNENKNLLNATYVVDCKGVSITNKGSGKIDFGGIATVKSYDLNHKQFDKDISTVKGTTMFPLANLKREVVMKSMNLVITRAFTPSRSNSVYVDVHNGSEWVRVGSFAFNSGQTYNVGQNISVPLSNVPYTGHNQDFRIFYGTSPGVDVYADVNMTFNYREF